MFLGYFRTFRDRFGTRLPALIPQVYLHYDPKTVRELGGNRRYPRRRMDFLMLLRNDARIMIEMDGKHHYADDDGKASPERYAGMVSADRDLRLRGYEVYRFGGKEMCDKDAAATIQSFFERLFSLHGVR